MYLKCDVCNQREHLSKWVRVGVYSFKCPHCGAIKIV